MLILKAHLSHMYPPQLFFPRFWTKKKQNLKQNSQTIKTKKNLKTLEKGLKKQS